MIEEYHHYEHTENLVQFDNRLSIFLRWKRRPIYFILYSQLPKLWTAKLHSDQSHSIF